MPSKDLILDLIECIQKDHDNYIIGIIKKTDDENQEKIEIYTSLGENPIDKLMKILKEYKKSLQNKQKSDIVDKLKDDNANI